MRKLLLALLLVPGMLLAQPFKSDKPTVCDELSAVMTHLSEKYHEVPVWSGAGAGKLDSNTVIMLLVNHETRSWTMIQYDERVACILGVGENFQFTKEAFGTPT